MWVAGIDGCRTGWIAALAPLDGSRPPQARVARDLASLIDAAERPAVIALDMPIGLPERIEGAGRLPEQLVRPLLGARQSSVFSIPSRAAIFAGDYATACHVALETSDPPRKVSKQGFMIFPKIREADALVRARPELTGRVHEVHPELAFWSMNGGRPLSEPKKVKSRPHAPGLALRQDLLIGAGLSPETVLAPPPSGAGPDDWLDALAGLVVARKIGEGRGRPFPDPPGRDAYGLPVAIWTFRTEGFP